MQPSLTGYAKRTAALPPVSIATLPCVSVLVAAWNEAAYLPNFLDSYGALTYPHKELILCVGGSDHSYDLAQQWQGAPITLLAQHQGEGKYRALQRGLQQAQGAIIYLTDADCVLDDVSFQQLIAPLVAGQETVVTGGFRPLTAQLGLPLVVAQWMMERGEQIQTAKQPGGQPIYTPFLVGANCALTRPTLTAGWRGPLANSIGEDYYLALQVGRMGQRIRFCPASSVQTRYPVTLGAYILRKSRWHRSWLLHHYQLGDRRWIRNCLSSLRFQLLLALPLLPLILGLSGVALWGIVWTWCFAQYRRRQALFAASAQADITQADIATVGLHHLLLLMLADFCAWAIIPFQMIMPRWRKQW
jgi:cellulose synthase/poly-beta-1,6-N-acetylglucosamine synthase-like glycosyltransferase